MMKKRSLFEVLKKVGVPFDPALIKDGAIDSVVCDSKEVREGSIFVAIRGSKADGNDFIAEACQKGATLIVTEKAPPTAPSTPLLRVENARRIYALANHVLYGEPSKELKMVGVTGTNGKTTCAYLIHAIASTRCSAGLVGTIQYFFGSHSVAATHTTPDPSTLHPLFNLMCEKGCSLVVMEASSHALDQERLSGIRFDAVLFTNLTQDHLDYHHSMEEYFNAKLKLLQHLKDGGTAVLNADDSWIASIGQKARKVVTYGIEQPADIRALDVQSGLGGSRFDIEYQGQRTAVQTALFGKHNVYNILGAISAASSIGVAVDESARVMRDFKGVPGRLERVDAGQEFFLFVDYAHTDDGLRNVLSALRPLAHKKLLVLFGCGGDRDKGKRPKMARVAEQLADYVVLTSDNPRFEDPRSILKDVSSGFSPGFDRCEVHPDRRKAIRQILLKAHKEDVVLLAGKGHEDTQIIGNERMPFNDKEEAVRILNGL